MIPDPPTEEDAQAFIEAIAYSDRFQPSEGKLQEALGRCSTWLQHEYGQDERKFEFTFDGSGGNNQPRDFLTIEERREIRSQALEYSVGGKVTSLPWTSLDAGLRPVEAGNAKTSRGDTQNALLRIPTGNQFD